MATHDPRRQHLSTSARRFGPVDLGLILLVTGLVRWVSGAQRFTFLHTPDSEFYYSLGVFGSAVTDRAPIDMYYWTKLGIVLPVRGLSELLEPVSAVDTFHAGLLLLIVGSGYVVARLHWSRLGACLSAGFLALNTVVLGFLGDPYASGAALAGLSVLLATATVWTLGPRPFPWPGALLLGLTGAWLVMINPYALIVGAAGCAGILLANARRVMTAGARALSTSGIALLGGFVGGFVAFLALGWWVFPGLSWFDSLNAFLSANDLASWAAKDWAWLPSETSLLVPVAGALVSLIALVAMPRSVPVRTGAGLQWVTIVAAVGYKLASESNVLEHSVYSSMLWPATLLGLVLVASGTTEPALGPAAIVVAGATPVVWIAAGHWSADVSTAGALVLVAVTVLSVGWLLAWGRAGRVLLSTARPVAAVGVVALLVLGAGFQVLQNGRPLDPTKLHRRVPYSAAFHANDVAAILAQDAQIQAWLIEATDSDEQLLVWNEADTRSAASMQLWGPNTAGSGFGGPLGDVGMSRIRLVRPDAVVAYATDAAAIDAIRAELESEWRVPDPVCQTFPAVDAPAPVEPVHARAPIQVCILRLEPHD